MYTYSCSERTDCATTAILHKQSWLFRFWKPKPSVWGWSNWGAPQNLTDVRKKLFGESWQRFAEHDVLLLNASKHRPVSWPVFLFVRPASFLN